jgi:DNA polymerase-4
MHTAPPLPKALHHPADFRVLYVDMNSFFASVEQQDHPELRHQPLSVVSHNHPRGTILASSYEAKRLEVSTGMKIKQARLLVPNLHIREVHPFRYKQVHEQFMAILQKRCGPGVHAKSIDEAVIYLPKNWQNQETTTALAQAIKRDFSIHLGSCITCSIGIAPNRLLAKLGTELHKPDGLTTITLAATRSILETIPLTMLNGIAERSEIQLHKAGIATAVDFYDAPVELLRRHFGAWGQYWWWRLHGYECDGHMQQQPLHSMSHEHVLAKTITKKSELESLIGKMTDKLCYRLQRNLLQCTSLSISIRWASIARFENTLTLDAPSNATPILIERYMSLIAALPSQFPDAVKKLTISMNHLSSYTGHQPTLWQQQITKSERLGPALTLVRAKHGFSSIVTASSLAEYARTVRPQLGFGRIGDTGNLE